MSEIKVIHGKKFEADRLALFGNMDDKDKKTYVEFETEHLARKIKKSFRNWSKGLKVADVEDVDRINVRVTMTVELTRKEG